MNDRPNVLLILSDQHKADCIGAYGNTDVRTPNIDRLAERGITYEQAYCPLPVCTPSRYSLLTGLYVHQHGGWTNHCSLPSGFDTFPRIFAQNGYRTGAIGKMHFTPTYLDVGFEHMLLAEQHGPGRYDDDYHRYLMRNELIDVVDTLDQVEEYRRSATDAYWSSMGAMESNLPEDHHSTTWIGRHAVQELEQWGSQPSLLMVGFVKPHHPHDPPSPWSTMYNPDTLTLPAGWQESCPSDDLLKHRGFFAHNSYTEATLRRTLALYYGSITHIDHWVGRMLAVLERRNLLENTIVIYMSDHGDYMGYHHMVGKNGYMYDPIVQVPLIVKSANGVAAPARRSGLVSTLDVAPSILESAGLPRGRGMNGLNIFGSGASRQAVFAENHGGSDYMVRTQSHKLLLSKHPESNRLFDLRADPTESHNLYHAKEHAQIREQLTRRLMQWLFFDSTGVEPIHERACSVATASLADEVFRRRHEMRDYIRSAMQGWVSR